MLIRISKCYMEGPISRRYNIIIIIITTPRFLLTTARTQLRLCNARLLIYIIYSMYIYILYTIIRSLTRPPPATGCHLLFRTGSSRPSLHKIILYYRLSPFDPLKPCTHRFVVIHERVASQLY